MRGLKYWKEKSKILNAKKRQVEGIVIGHNEDQKQNIRIGKQNNQNFVSMMDTTESGKYTSKVSLLNLDNSPAYKSSPLQLQW